MPQQFHAVQCCSCSTCQVQQVKKIAKFKCAVCGEKQSVRQARRFSFLELCSPRRLILHHIHLLTHQFRVLHADCGVPHDTNRKLRMRVFA